MLTRYLNNDEYDLSGSFVIGDRATDVELALNLGCRAILLQPDTRLLENSSRSSELLKTCALVTDDWDKVSEYLFAGERRAEVRRTTHETDIYISVDLDGHGHCDISTGLGFFDHMLEQIGKHSGFDLTIHTKGDLHVDEHHTIEDTALDSRALRVPGVGRQTGHRTLRIRPPHGRLPVPGMPGLWRAPWLVWDVTFRRERIGDVPTEMFYHFFKSLSDAARMNLNIQAQGQNEHHKARRHLQGTGTRPEDGGTQGHLPLRAPYLKRHALAPCVRADTVRLRTTPLSVSGHIPAEREGKSGWHGLCARVRQ